MAGIDDDRENPPGGARHSHTVDLAAALTVLAAAFGASVGAPGLLVLLVASTFGVSRLRNRART